jgi:hypothetical protein
MKRIRFTRAELEMLNSMAAIASATVWGEGDYQDWDIEVQAKTFNSLRAKIWELIARADGLPNNFTEENN